MTMESDVEENGLVFSIPDLYGPSSWLQDVEETSGFLFSQLKLDDIDVRLPDFVSKPLEPSLEDAFFRAPDFSLLSFDAPAADVIPPSPTHAIIAVPAPVAEDEVDIWLLTEELPVNAATYHSWDSFDNNKNLKPQTPYITEAGPDILDTVLAGDHNGLLVENGEHVVVNSKVYISSLLSLGLGRSSVLFTWDEEKSEFVPTLSKMRLSGYTSECLHGSLSMFMKCGMITRSLQDFAERAYTKRRSQGQIALADAVSTLLTTIQIRLSESGSEMQSVLQLQTLFRPVFSILTCFQRIVQNTSRTRNDESMLSTVFEEIQLQEHRTDPLRGFLVEIICRISNPWLEFVSEWLGLRRESGLPLTKDGVGKGFVSVTDKEWVDELGFELQERAFVLDYEKVPSFIAPEDARAMFEVGRSLRFLKDHHSDHPLARADVVASASPPALEWKFSWQDIVAVESKALKYEQDLTAAIKQYSLPFESSVSTRTQGCSPFDAIHHLDFFGKPEEEMQAHVLASIDSLNLPLPGNDISDSLSGVLSAYLSTTSHEITENESMFSPPISLSPILSFNPIIAAQARIVNGTCMKMFFNSHNLRQHLSMQRSFHLLGNGVFSSRLSHALFDPDMESAERHRGVARSGGIMGLRLGGRDTWPPASSELRLALMGVLTDSYVSNESLSQAPAGGFIEKSLPGDLSFGVRDMSEEEIEKCMNADSIEALDFLRLTYKPPPPLETVITPIILFKYDQLFKLLLRILRMLYVISTLFRDGTNRNAQSQDTELITQRFRIEAHHFITNIAAYFFDSGIEATWQIFDRKLDEIETRINNDDNITIGQNEGLDKLRDYHERVLDRIMFALLLRKRQQPVLQLLEEIFAIILQFSKLSREQALGIERKGDSVDNVTDLYANFRKKLGVFITVCRGLSEKKGYGEKKALQRTGDQRGLFDGDDLVEENTISHLLLRLDSSNYYTRTVRG